MHRHGAAIDLRVTDGLIEWFTSEEGERWAKKHKLKILIEDNEYSAFYRK
jgi:hypothetical protein